MVISKEILTDFKEVYEKAIKFVNEESKNDPPTDPFRSHYVAKDLLTELMENLRNSVHIEEPNSDNQFTYKVILSFVYRDLGRIYVFTEDRPTGEKFLRQCIDLIEPDKMKPEAIIPYVGALNEMGIIFSIRQEHNDAFNMLSKSEKAFHEFKETQQKAMSITDVFGTKEEIEEGKGPNELESLFTLCTFYLAQVYSHLGQLDKSAEYCHLTLRRQMDSQSYESIDFSLNAATLSQYYIGQNRFKEARHHLAAATHIMVEHEAKMITPDMSDEEKETVTETFKHRYADVARCWAKYGLVLLLASKERLFNDDEKLTADTKKLTIDVNANCFPSLQLQTYENRITDEYCLTFDDAKLVYHFVITWLDQAKEYYKPDTEATEYAKIIKDYAELYQHIAFFEEDPNNQAKMHKRRATYYEDLLELLNPTFYLSICRECWYGAGLAFCAILDIKLDALKENTNPGPQHLQKINFICNKAIKHFLNFNKSYLNKDETSLQSDLSTDELQTVLYAYFHLGRLYYKMITADKSMQLENMRNSMKYYKLFVDMCAEYNEASKNLQAEIGVCKEMVNLLPFNIKSLLKRIAENSN